MVFAQEKDAEQALFYLDGGQIDGNVIKVSFVLVNAPRRHSPSPGNACPQQYLIFRNDLCYFILS